MPGSRVLPGQGRRLSRLAGEVRLQEALDGLAVTPPRRTEATQNQVARSGQAEEPAQLTEHDLVSGGDALGEPPIVAVAHLVAVTIAADHERIAEWTPATDVHRPDTREVLREHP